MSEFTLGQHEAKIDALTTEVAAVRRDIASILDILAEKRGERRVALWGVGAISSIVTMLLGYIGKVWVAHPK